jgi:Skp family chaperone for outer membrane proteins
MKQVLILGLVGLISLFFLSDTKAYAAEKYAFINVGEVFDGYQKTKDNDEVLQEVGASKESERGAIVGDIQKMKDELELMSDDAKKEKQETISARVRDLQDFDLQTRRELNEKRRTVIQEIFSDIDDVVRKYGKKKGMDFILNDKALLYQKKNLDVSEDILNELNKGYSAA